MNNIYEINKYNNFIGLYSRDIQFLNLHPRPADVQKTKSQTITSTASYMPPYYS